MEISNSLPKGSASTAAAPKTTSSRLKSIFSGSVGNMVEWYDWYVYAAFSLYFAKASSPRAIPLPSCSTRLRSLPSAF